MPIKPLVRARIDEQIKEDARLVLQAMGLTISDAFRILLTKVAREKKFPFEPFTPNDETMAAMKAVRNKETIKVETIDNLFKSLNERD